MSNEVTFSKHFSEISGLQVEHDLIYRLCENEKDIFNISVEYNGVDCKVREATTVELCLHKALDLILFFYENNISPESFKEILADLVFFQSKKTV